MIKPHCEWCCLLRIWDYEKIPGKIWLREIDTVEWIRGRFRDAPATVAVGPGQWELDHCIFWVSGNQEKECALEERKGRVCGDNLMVGHTSRMYEALGSISSTAPPPSLQLKSHLLTFPSESILRCYFWYALQGGCVLVCWDNCHNSCKNDLNGTEAGSRFPRRYQCHHNRLGDCQPISRNRRLWEEPKP